jgi:hypothetical protein
MTPSLVYHRRLRRRDSLKNVITKTRAHLVLPLLLGLALLSAAAFGQETATIVGTVTDTSGAAVPNAKITITNLESGFVRVTSTNNTGSYAARELPVGHYRVRAEAAGFRTFEQTSIALNVNDTVRQDVALQVGDVKETVTVEANPIAVQSETSDVSQTVTDTQISELATNGRNVLQLTTLVPGASSTMPDFDLPVAQWQNRSVFFNGMRQDANNWLIDGGEAYDRGGGGILLVSPSQEAVQEFKIETSNYAADLGNSSGGMISMSIKQGTRQFHGGAWEYNRNDALDAGNYLAKLNGQPTPELRYNAFGFNLGGPVEFKSSNPKTFFFYNQEWRREIQGGSVDHPSVPTSAEYGGNLSGMLYQVNGVTVHPIAPVTTDATRLAQYAADGLTAGQPFPSDTIPANLIDKNAALFLNSGFLVPAAANGGYFSGANTDTFYREEAVRIDHQFNNKLTVFGHFLYDSGHQTVPTPAWTGTTFTTLGSVEDVPSWAGVVHATISIKPNLLNEAAFNYNGNDITLADDGKWTQPSGWGTAPLFTGVNKLNKMPTINVGGGGIGFDYDPGNWPWTNTWRSYQYKDDLSWTHGAHNAKFGAALLHTHKNQEIFADVAGNYNFNGSASWNSTTNALQYSGTGYALGDFLLGDAANFTQVQLQDFVSITFNNIDVYAMDDWRVSKRLTLNLGLRWEGLPHAYDTNARASNFYPNLYNPADKPIFPNQATGSEAMDTSGPGFATVPGVKLSSDLFYINGIGLSGRNGIPKGLVQNHWTTFAPRLGFAYDLTGDEKTILRGGGGIFFERNAGNEEYNMGSNVPFTNNSQVNTPDFTNPLVDWTNGNDAGTSPYTPHGFTGIPDNYPITTVYQFNLGLQRQLTNNAVFSLAYVGNTADHLSQTQDINTVPANDPNRAAIVSGQYKADFDRPYLGWSGINIVYNEGNSHYNGLQASVRATAWKNLTLSAAYTYSHAFDVIDAQLFNNISDPMNPRYDYGTAGYDRRQILTFNYVYAFPFFRNSSGAARALLGGWTLSGIVLAQTGTPLTVNAIGDNLGFGGDTTNHADLVAPITYPKTFNNWFSPTSFAQPATLTWGDAPRNIVKGPGRDGWNLSLYKAFKFTERVGFEFRADAFNLWNHTQFTGVDTSLGDYNVNPAQNGFGKINAVADPRVFQLGGKISF